MYNRYNLCLLNTDNINYANKTLSVCMYVCIYVCMHVVGLARSRLAQTDSRLLQDIVKKQSASRIFHMEEDVIQEFSREGLLSTLEAEHLLQDVQRAAAGGVGGSTSTSSSSSSRL